jgi:uncharacterized membrane protein (DUF4010 family)
MEVSSWLTSVELRLCVALAVGMLIGAERERSQLTQRASNFAGLRTFGLVSLLGGLFAHSHEPWLLTVGAAITGLTSLAAYVVHRNPRDPGVTSEIALVVAYALGALALEKPLLSAAASVVVTVLLAAREPMHKLLRETLTQTELRDALIFLLFALVVLPVAPDVRLGPFGALHPPSIARLIVALMAISGAGYMAQRLLGPRYGLVVTGFAGGFISSSATIAALGAQAKAREESWRSAVSGALASCVATILQFLLILLAVNPSLALRALPALGLSGASAVLLTLIATYLAARVPQTPPPSGRAFGLGAALGVAALVCAVSIASAALHAYAGRFGIIVISVVAALVDAHSTTGSVAALHESGAIDGGTALYAVLASLSANSVTKILLAFSGRHLKFGVSVSVGVLLVALSAWLGFWIGGGVATL